MTTEQPPLVGLASPSACAGGAFVALCLTPEAVAAGVARLREVEEVATEEELVQEVWSAVSAALALRAGS